MNEPNNERQHMTDHTLRLHTRSSSNPYAWLAGMCCGDQFGDFVLDRVYWYLSARHNYDTMRKASGSCVERLYRVKGWKVPGAVDGY